MTTQEEPGNSNSHTERKFHKVRLYAENVKILIQMFIGIVLVLFLLLKVFGNINVFHPFLQTSPRVPSNVVEGLQSLAMLNPLEIVAYGLYFSTGIDLAYMLFTPGPDEAIDPVMTGLAATILLGIANIDFAHLQGLILQVITLFLAVGALAGLVATKKYLFHSLKNEKDRAVSRAEEK